MKIAYLNKLFGFGLILAASLSTVITYGQPPASELKLKQVSYISPKPQIKKLVDSPSNKSLLKLGEKLSTSKLKAERDRLISYLQVNGIAVDSNEVLILVDATTFEREYMVYFTIKRPINSMSPF